MTEVTNPTPEMGEVVEQCANIAEEMILYTGWDIAAAIRERFAGDALEPPHAKEQS